MVQILPRNPQTGLGRGILEGLIEGGGDALSNYLGRRRTGRDQERDLELQRAESEALGLPREVISPQTRAALIGAQGRQQQQAQKSASLNEALPVLTEAFGEPFAKVYSHLTQGGQTALLKQTLEAKQRGLQVEDVLGRFVASNPDLVEVQDRERAAEQEEALQERQEPMGAAEPRPDLAVRPRETPTRPAAFPKISLPGNKTPREKEQYRTQLRKENAPIVEKVHKDVRASEKQLDDLGVLEELAASEKLPRGFKRILVDPDTGEVRKWAQLLQLQNPETELFTKTINDFTTQAKDSFGARVTNFDLQTFKSRLPSLLNSPQGIDLILNQMRTITGLNQLHDNELAEIYDHYGAQGIAPEKARRLAEKRIKPRADELRKKFYKADRDSIGIAAGGDRLTVRNAEGQEGTIPRSQLEEARAQGFQEI